MLSRPDLELLCESTGARVQDGLWWQEQRKLTVKG